MPGQEKEKSEGGNDLNEQQVESIVMRVLAAQREKGKATQDLGMIRSEVGELKGELGKIKGGMFCTADGKYCFYTPEELSDWMAKQGEKIDSLDSKIGEVATQVRGLAEAGKKQTLPGGISPLADMTAEIRAGMSREADEARDQGVKAIADYFHVSDNDMYKRIEKVPANLDAIAKKGNMRKRVLDTVSDEERKKVVLYGCKDGKCRVWRENMEKEEGIKFYAKDERGRFQPVDKPERELSHI